MLPSSRTATCPAQPAAPNHPVAACVAALALLVQQPQVAAAAGPQDHSWQPCTSGSSCVSTNSFMKPAQYLPPWLYAPAPRGTALRALLGEVEARSGTLLEVDEADGYVLARVPWSTGASDFDELQFLLQPDGVVLFKSQASANRPAHPFCLTPGCISGPPNRQRLERLRDDLGWGVLEPDDDKQWVQILLH